MCEVSRPELIAWIDGESRDSALERHVSGCPECQREAGRIRQLSRDIGEYCIAMSAERPARRRWWMIPVAAAAVILLATGLVWLRSSRQPAPPVVAVRPVIHPAVVRAGLSATPPEARHRSRRRRPMPPMYADIPGVLVVVNLEELLPPGAAPPGAVLVGKITFDDTRRNR